MLLNLHNKPSRAAIPGGKDIRTMVEFYGTIKITPKYSKCDPLIVTGHWTKKDIGKPYKVWCNDNLYRHGINEEICEIVNVEKQIKEETV